MGRAPAAGSRAAIALAVERFGRIVLINNAGIIQMQHIDRMLPRPDLADREFPRSHSQ